MSCAELFACFCLARLSFSSCPEMGRSVSLASFSFFEPARLPSFLAVLPCCAFASFQLRFCLLRSPCTIFSSSKNIQSNQSNHILPFPFFSAHPTFLLQAQNEQRRSVVRYLQNMNSQNKIFQAKESQQTTIIEVIKSFLSSTFFKIVSHFQSKTHINQPYFGFSLAKLPSIDYSDMAQHRSIQLVVGGHNLDIKITCEIIRVIHYQDAAYCLARDTYEMTEYRYFPLIILFPDTKAAEQWCRSIHYLSKVTAYNPFASFYSFFKSIMVVVRYDCLQIEKLQIAFDKAWEDAKLRANECFKRKDYKEALVFYELALGLIWSSENIKERAILYSNAAQSFFELNLYENTLLYANIAITLDKTSVKSYYRKLCSLLELNQYDQVTKLLPVLFNYSSKEEFTTAHERYTRHMANASGLFNWQQILSKKSTSFGEYLNSKIVIEDEPNKRYISQGYIEKYELVAVQKTAISIIEISDKRSHGIMKKLSSDVNQMANLQSRFADRIKSMLQRQVQQTEKNMQPTAHAYSFKSIFLKERVVAICPEYTYFKVHEDIPNCCFLYIKGAFFYFAMKKIKPLQVLSVQLFNRFIDAPIVSSLLVAQPNKFTLQNYLKNRQSFIEQQDYRSAIRYLWKLLRDPQQNRIKVVYELIEMSKYIPFWEISIVIINQLHVTRNFSDRNHLKVALVYLFERFFKSSTETAMKTLDRMISE